MSLEQREFQVLWKTGSRQERCKLNLNCHFHAMTLLFETASTSSLLRLFMTLKKKKKAPNKLAKEVILLAAKNVPPQRTYSQFLGRL